MAGTAISSPAACSRAPRQAASPSASRDHQDGYRSYAAQLLRTRDSRPRSARERGAEAHRCILCDRERDPRPQRGGASPHAAAEEPTTGRCLEVSPHVKLALISQKIELAEAIRYALSRWQDLTRFIDDGRIELDNNIVERSTRVSSSVARTPVCRIRRSCRTLGCRRVPGRDLQAQRRRSAPLSPDVLTRIVNGHPNRDVDQLLPWPNALKPAKPWPENDAYGSPSHRYQVRSTAHLNRSCPRMVAVSYGGNWVMTV